MDESTELAEQMPANIGRYQVQGCIGYGAMGAVYKAFDPLIKRVLAIKTIRLDIPRNAPQYKSFIERFQHEARISGTLSHPNIVTLFDIGEEGGAPFLAMEFVSGKTIAEIIESGERFDPERVIGLVSQIAAAIDYAHSKGVVHRDIKPSNLILSEGDRVKVTDFGIAKLADTEMTQSGVLLGTPSYMSPEQAMGEKLDGRSDIFSLGVCAFEMLSGEQPFPGNNVTSILYKLVHVDPIEPATLEMDGLIPHKWREVFGKVLAKKPDDRYQKAADFVRDLEYCLGSWFGAMGDETLVMPSVGALPVHDAEQASTIAPVSAETPADEAPTLVGPSAMRTAVGLGGGAGLGTSMAVPLTPPPAEEPATLLMSAVAPAGRQGMGAVTGAQTVAPAPVEDDEAATVLMSAASVAAKGAGAARTPVPANPSATARLAPTPAPTTRTPPPPTVASRPASPAPRVATRPGASTQGRPRGWHLPLGGILGAAGFAVVLVVGGVALRGRFGAERPMDHATTATPPAKSAGAPPEVVDGFLRITTRPTGAAVTINGEPRGVTPVEARLPLGLYDVQITLKGHNTQARTVDLTTARPKADLDIGLERADVAPALAAADIGSTPSGADVWVDGVGVGVTPLKGYELAAGERRIEFRKTGYEAAVRVVAAQVGRRLSVDVTLSAVEARPAPRPSATPAVDVRRVYLPREVDTPATKTVGDSPDSSGMPRLKRGERVSVTVEFVVTEDGTVTDVEIVESQVGERLDQAVRDALKKWRFTPAVKGGVKVKVRESRKFTYQAG